MLLVWLSTTAAPARTWMKGIRRLCRSTMYALRSIRKAQRAGNGKAFFIFWVFQCPKKNNVEFVLLEEYLTFWVRANRHTSAGIVGHRYESRCVHTFVRRIYCTGTKYIPVSSESFRPCVDTGLLQTVTYLRVVTSGLNREKKNNRIAALHRKILSIDGGKPSLQVNNSEYG